jgi:outer membrane protein insertion porin family
MLIRSHVYAGLAWLALAGVAAAQPAAAQPAASPAPQTQPLPPITACAGSPPYTPAAQPPAGSGPVVLTIAPCFAAQGGSPLVDIQTYLYYMQASQKISAPSRALWVPYTDETEQTMRDDFKRLWATGFLDNLSIETEDYDFPNGTVGKILLYNMEERQRVKIVDYVGSKKIETSKIDEKLKEQKIELRLDTFLDPATVTKVKDIVRGMMVEKGFPNAEVTTEIKPTSDATPKLVHLTFHVNEGPNVKIRDIEFVGNKELSDGALEHHMKENKAHNWLSFISGHGTYDQTKFDLDAELVTDYYRDNGYIQAVVGAPEVKVLEDDPDGKTRWIQLRIPVQEGRRYKVGEFKFDGNTVVKSEVLRPLFDIKEGDYYDQEKIRKGYQKAQELYGAGGYWEFTAYPDNVPRDQTTAQANVPAALAAQPEGPPIVDVTMKVLEGKQYFVNRITFAGNTTTRDNVIRREMRLLEDGVFNTEALKFSVRRLNQLGYFKPLEPFPQGKDVTVEKVAGDQARVNVNLKLEEQNRNQLQFGAGVSQFEGFFGQLSFQTSNFLGRGESLTLALQGGSRANNYSIAFTEPFLFDRNITGSANIFRSEIRYIGQFTQQTTGGVASLGWPLGRGFTRMFTSYSYERVRVSDIADYYTQNPDLLKQNPFLADQLLLGQNGERIISQFSPSLVYNSVDQPIFPTTGKRLTLSADLAGIGGNTNFYKPTLEGIWYLRENSRMSFGMRGQLQYIHTFSGDSKDLPIFERLYLGGEYTVRGYDFRTIGPSDPVTGLVLGGNKSLLFNFEQYFNVASAVRLILFYDAGQVKDVGQPFSMQEDAIERVLPDPPILFDPLASQFLADPNANFAIGTRVTGQQSAFKTSTGAEVRFFMPVLNVPFRLIFAYNPQRGGVLNNSFLPQSKFAFRFAVGTTF